MKTSYDLSPEEMEELKGNYFEQLRDTTPDVLGDVDDPQQLSDEVIHMAYGGVFFVEEDFFCNINNNEHEGYK